jgi:hypothetical protein
MAVSTAGGYLPRWRPDGRELFYIAPDRKLVAVDLEARSGFKATAPGPLFQTRISGSVAGGVRFNYAVAPDGKRFVVVTDPEITTPATITVVPNWAAELKK